MNKRFAILFLTLCFGVLKSQNFGALPYLDNGIGTGYLERVLFDSVHNKLILSAKDMNYANGKKVRGICSWNGIQYDSLKSGINSHDITLNPNQANGLALGCIPYNGKLLVGGNFESIGGVNASGLATWDGTQWDSLPVRAFKFLDYGGMIYNFIRFNNKLYLCGQFDSIQGMPANSFATFNGSSFQALPIPITSVGGVTDMKVFNNDLYISGVFTYSPQTTNRHILRYDGSNFYSVGGGVKGSISSISSMAVYNNELYVGGYFKKADGNVADVLMKWDGVNWKDAGWGNMYNNANIWKLLVHNNKLYAFGSFNYCADQPASKIAVFDGMKWCSYADTINGTVFSADIYRDTIHFAGAFTKIGGDTAKKYVAKLALENNINICVNVGLKEYSNSNVFKVYPNPAQTNLFVNTEGFSEKTSFKMYNPLGQILKTGVLESTNNSVNVSDLPQGMYLIEVFDKNLKSSTKFIKND